MFDSIFITSNHDGGFYMKIEVWSDFVCPFCYIGKRRLEQVIDTLPFKNEIEVSFKSFELDPNVETDYSVSIEESLAKKYGTSLEQIRQMNENVINLAKSVGLNYNFDNMSPTNTFKAHRLAKFAETKGKLGELTERLLRAHFIESKRIDENEVLIELAKEVGLDQEEAKQVLENNWFAEDVRKDEREAQSIGVRGVPFFVLNRKYAISGAQGENVFKNALVKVWKEENNIE